MNNRYVLLIGLVVSLALLLVGCQSGPSAEEITAKMRDLEANVDSVHTVVAVDFDLPGSDQTMVVEVWEKKPDKYRMELLESTDPDNPAGSLVVSDGDQVWMYEPADNEVIVGTAGDMYSDDGPSNLREILDSMDQLVQEMLDTSQVKLLGEEEVIGIPAYKIKLTTNDDDAAPLPPGSETILWVDQERWIVLRAQIDIQGAGQGQMEVRSLDLNTGIADSQFDFEIPSGVEVRKLEDLKPRHMTLDEAQEQADFHLLVPEYVPEGTTLVDVFAVEGRFGQYYDHSDTPFTILQGSPAVDQLPVGKQTEITVRDEQATLVTDEAAGDSFLSWQEGNNLIIIAGHLSPDEAVKIAESLQ